MSSSMEARRGTGERSGQAQGRRQHERPFPSPQPRKTHTDVLKDAAAVHQEEAVEGDDHLGHLLHLDCPGAQLEDLIHVLFCRQAFHALQLAVAPAVHVLVDLAQPRVLSAEQLCFCQPSLWEDGVLGQALQVTEALLTEGGPGGEGVSVGKEGLLACQSRSQACPLVPGLIPFGEVGGGV